MSDKLDIVIGMINKLDSKVDTKFDEIGRQIVDFKLEIKKVEFRHDNCPGEAAISKLEAMESDIVETVGFYKENKENLETAATMMKRPKLFMATLIGAAAIVVVGLITVYLSVYPIKEQLVPKEKDKPKTEGSH